MIMLTQEDRAYLRDERHIPENVIDELPRAAEYTKLRHDTEDIDLDGAISLMGRRETLAALAEAAIHVNKIVFLKANRFVIFNALPYFLKKGGAA